MMIGKPICCVLCVIECVAVPLRGAVVWTEGNDGDLSNLSANPTPLNFSIGTNTVRGTMGTPPFGDLDPDTFRFTIPADEFLTSIYVDSITPGQNSLFVVSTGSSIDMFNGSSLLSNFLISALGEYFQNLELPEFGGHRSHRPAGSWHLHRLVPGNAGTARLRNELYADSGAERIPRLSRFGFCPFHRSKTQDIQVIPASRTTS